MLAQLALAAAIMGAIVLFLALVLRLFSGG
jgi:putative effector of murein hydrolase LrgA (UPF0299 family)